MKWEIPYPKVLGWKMKTTSSAITDFKILKNNVYGCYIEHDVVKKCTPEMIEWWFRNIEGEMEYKGVKYSRYILWHPVDHIHWSLEKKGDMERVGTGSKFRIVEAFSSNEKWMIDVVETVEKLDVTGIKLRNKRFGVSISTLEHEFIRHPEGTKYISTLKVGVDNFFGKYFINPLINRFIFNKQMAHAWLKHNVEEVGNFEFFLPELYMKNNT